VVRLRTRGHTRDLTTVIGYNAVNAALPVPGRGDGGVHQERVLGADGEQAAPAPAHSGLHAGRDGVPSARAHWGVFPVWYRTWTHSSRCLPMRCKPAGRRAGDARRPGGHCGGAAHRQQGRHEHDSRGDGWPQPPAGAFAVRRRRNAPLRTSPAPRT
jgi:hypothetical protein